MFSAFYLWNFRLSHIRYTAALKLWATNIQRTSTVSRLWTISLDDNWTFWAPVPPQRHHWTTAVFHDVMLPGYPFSSCVLPFNRVFARLERWKCGTNATAPFLVISRQARRWRCFDMRKSSLVFCEAAFCAFSCLRHQPTHSS